MRARPAVILSLLVALSAGVGGCAASAPPSTFANTAAAELQSAVLAVTEAAQSGDYAAAAGQLDALEAAAIGAFARGEMSDARFDAIMVAIGLVRGDLEAAISASIEPEETTEPVVDPAPPASGTGGSGGTGGTSSGPTGTTDPAPTETSKGNGRGSPGVPGPPDHTGKPNKN